MDTLGTPLKAINAKECLQNTVSLMRIILICQEKNEEIQLDTFGDASIHGVGAPVTQAFAVAQDLITAKSCLARKGSLGISGWENVPNLTTAQESFLLISDKHCWQDSTVALHWIHNNGECWQFVAIHVNKIQSVAHLKWHHMLAPTNDRPRKSWIWSNYIIQQRCALLNNWN